MNNFIEKIKKLPENLRTFFISDDPMIEMKKSFIIFGINSDLSKNIAKEIGKIFVRDLELKNLPQIIKNNIKLDDATATGISYEINKRIFNRFPEYFLEAKFLLNNWEKYKKNQSFSEDDLLKKITELEPWMLGDREEMEEKNNEKMRVMKQRAERLVNVSIVQALRQHPDVGEQAITTGMIKLRIFPEPVRPSIKNWIEDYHQNMGATKHGMMERGNYLFHSENTRRLTAGERKKLGEVLRSLDEDVTLKIDPDRQEVVFEEPGNAGGSNYGAPIIESKQNPNFKAQIPNRPFSASPALSRADESSSISSQNISNPKPVLNPNIRFSSPQIMPSERKKEIMPVSKVIEPANFQKQVERNAFSARHNNPIINPMAGRPWEPHNVQRSEPKIVGNIVDLKN